MDDLCSLLNCTITKSPIDFPLLAWSLSSLSFTCQQEKEIIFISYEDTKLLEATEMGRGYFFFDNDTQR